MEYSPIKSIRTKNFMCIGDANVDLTKSPITCLMGENESGKTSFMKSIAVCSANAFETEQKDYIRVGTAGFGVAIELIDGTLVTRIKRRDGNIYEVSQPNKDTWRTDKIDRGYGTPKPVADVMGFVVEPETKELLNIRTYEDKSLFVLTKTSENYKVMYNALKVDNLTRAIKEGTKQANTARSDINTYEKSINTLEDSLKRIKIVNMEPALLIRQRIESELEQLELLEQANRLIEKNQELEKKLGYLVEVQNKQEINETEIMLFSKLNSIIQRSKEIEEENKIYEKLNGLSEIDYSLDEKIKDVVDLIDRTVKIESKNKAYMKLRDISEVNEYELNIFNRVLWYQNRNSELETKINKELMTTSEIDTMELEVLNKLNRIYQLSYVLGQCDNALKQLSVYEQQCEDVLKQLGAKVVNCPKCGEEIVIADDKNYVDNIIE